MVSLGQYIEPSTRGDLWAMAQRTVQRMRGEHSPKDAPVKTYGADAVARRREQKKAYMARMRAAARALGVKETRRGFVQAIKARAAEVGKAFALPVQV